MTIKRKAKHTVGRRRDSKNAKGLDLFVRHYDRLRDLPALIPLWPRELRDTSQSGHLKLLSKLRQALRHERQRGLSGHWSYNVARHKALLDAYRYETQQARKSG
ncbi:MAG: hypothetical protein K0U34_01340 [Alphaproteobacteria bacterium]|nr:hypothetical protein [Alphaproteobacteria bacterium]